MNKKRFLSALLAVLMVLVSVPLDSIKVMAGIDGNAGLEYSYDSTNNTASVTGYAADSAATVKRIIIPETVTNENTTYTVKSINASALNSTKLPKLQEVAVLGDDVVIGENAFGKYQDGTVDTNVTVWCNAGSSAYEYAVAQGLNKKYLNVKDLVIDSPTSTYYTGCEPFEISTVIKASDTSVSSSDIIWKTDNTELAYFTDEDGGVVSEAQGTLTDNGDGTTTVKIKVYVCDNTVRKSGTVKITATCRGTGNSAEKTYTIKKATTKITPVISVYRPVVTDEGKITVTDYNSTSQTASIIYEEVPEAELIENGYMFNNTLYIDTTYGYSIDGTVDEDSDDWCSISCSTDENTKSVVGQKLSTSEGTVTITGIKDNEGNIINEDIMYASAVLKANSSVTLFSQNNVLSEKIGVKVCQPATDMKMKADGAEMTDGGAYTGLVQDNWKLTTEFIPSSSTDTVVWTSSDENVAKINEGNNLYFNSAGRATITCTVQDSRSGKRNLKKSFTVISLAQVQYKEIVFAADDSKTSTINEKFLALGEEYIPIICDARNGEIYIAGDNETAANERLTYNSSDAQIAKVDNGVIIAGTKTGTAVITVTSTSGVSNSISIKVYAPAESINVSTAVTVPEGQTLDIPYALNPASATEDVTWTTENRSIATGEDYIDDNGNRFLRLTGVKSGSVTFTGKTVQTSTQVRVNVTVAPAVHADEISLQLDGDDVNITTDDDGNTVYNIPKGSTMHLKPVLKSSTGVTVNDQIQWLHEALPTGQEICTYSLQNDNTYSITSSKAGTTYVILKAYGGSFEKSVKCYINVYVPATEVDIYANNASAAEYMVELGSTVPLKGVLKPGDSTDSINWTTDGDSIELTETTSSNNTVINIVANKIGTTVLKAQTNSGVSDTVKVHVIKKATSIKFVQDGQEVDTGYVSYKGTKTISLNVLEADTTDTTFTWGSVVDNGLLKITPNEDSKSAVIEGLAPGTQQIKVTAPSGFTATLNVNVVVPATSIELNSTELSIYKGDPAVNIKAFLSPSETTDVVKWIADKDGIISITPDSANSTKSEQTIKVTGIDAGTVNLTAVTVDNLTATITINVRAKDINDEAVQVSNISAQTYTGKEITPSFNVTTSDNKTLRKDTDYTVSYSDNINAGQAKITIEGIGNYSGTKTVNFEISPKNISSVPNSSVTAAEYNGKEYIPEIVLTDSGSGKAVVLEKNKDYTVEYKNNINAGNATATVTGKGNYTGEKAVNFQITAKDMGNSTDIVISAISSMTYTGNSLTPNVVVKDGETVLEKDKDYTVSYTNNVNVGKATVTVIGKGNYKGNKTAEFTINRCSLSKATIAAIPNQIYTGKSITPGVSVTLSNRTLALNRDFKISYSNNKKPGKATIKITGMGNYSSSKTKTFIILPLAPKNPKMSSCTYNSTTLKWSKATGATGYYVYAYNAKKGKYYKVASSAKNTVKLKKLAAGTNNSYQIYSYVKVGSKIYKSTSYVTVNAGTATKAPSIKKVTTANSSVQLTWKNITGAQGYTVYYSTSKKGKYKKLNVTGVSATVTGLKANRTYYFKIRAYRNINGKLYYSSYSAIKGKKVKK